MRNSRKLVKLQAKLFTGNMWVNFKQYFWLCSGILNGIFRIFVGSHLVHILINFGQFFGHIEVRFGLNLSSISASKTFDSALWRDESCNGPSWKSVSQPSPSSALLLRGQELKPLKVLCSSTLLKYSFFDTQSD